MNPSDPLAPMQAKAFRVALTAYLHRHFPERGRVAETTADLGISPLTLQQFLSGNRIPTAREFTAIVECLARGPV